MFASGLPGYTASYNNLKCTVKIKVKQTYISTSSTFCDFELEDGNLIINNDWFTVWTAGNNELGGVHLDGGRVVPNGENKVLIPSAL